MTAKLTPSQTVGPFLAIGLPWPDGPFVVPEGTAGAITLTGRVFDGAGDLVTDALVETWQAGPDGRFAHPDDPRGAAGPGFRGFGRCPTGPDGSYRIVLTVSDEDGGSSSVEQTIAVANVAPTPSIVSIGAVRIEGTSIAVSGAATDPAGANDTLSYSWQV